MDDELKFTKIEKYIFKNCKRFIIEYTQKKYSCDEILNKFSSFLLVQLRSLEKLFCEYLNTNIGNALIIFNYRLKAINLLATLTNFTVNHYIDFMQLQRASQGEFKNLNNVYILSFNYTVLFDILNIKRPCTFSNVHGTICGSQCEKDCNSLNIIFGIDDSVIPSAYSEMRLFSKTYRKMLSNIEPQSILPPKNNNTIVIKFYGHSLSKADYSYFKSIFDYYDLYSNYNVSLIFYYSKGYENYDAVYKLINEYGKTLNNKDQGKNLLHKLLLENRLKICIIHDQE